MFAAYFLTCRYPNQFIHNSNSMVSKVIALFLKSLHALLGNNRISATFVRREICRPRKMIYPELAYVTQVILVMYQKIEPKIRTGVLRITSSSRSLAEFMQDRLKSGVSFHMGRLFP